MPKSKSKKVDVVDVVETDSFNDDTIDREQENKDIVSYQETQDLEILTKIYKKRIKTLKNWANKHFFPGLTDSVEDFCGDLRRIPARGQQKVERARRGGTERDRCRRGRSGSFACV